jgi:hypothetical protein
MHCGFCSPRLQTREFRCFAGQTQLLDPRAVIEVPQLIRIVHRAIWFLVIAGLCLALLRVSSAADKDKIVWKSIPDAMLQVDSRAPKIWNVFQPGKKFDPLLLQLGSRYLVIYVRSMEIYEIKPEQLGHKGDDLLWRETDKSAKPIATSDWSSKDVGSAMRILVKLTDEGRVINIQIPQVPDLRRGIY